MNRLLAAVGLAAVACLTLVLTACTDVVSPDDNPLLESQTVAGTVYWGHTGNTVDGAQVTIYYWDGNSWEYARDGLPPYVYSHDGGLYGVYYIDEAKNHLGKADAKIGVGAIKYTGSTQFNYPDGTHISGVDIRIFSSE